MTTKVLKGSIWTLAGQVLPLFVSLVSTHFVIKYLGSESYGILILVALIPNYYAFADFGMGIASTKFGSEAYGRGEREKEGAIVRTATLIALTMTLILIIPTFIFSDRIVGDWFRVPENYRATASIGLKLTATAFCFTVLSAVLNTPQLARLRMDLNTIASAAPKILAGLITPLVLYFGGHVVEAVWVSFFAGLLTFIGTTFMSGRLLPELYRPTIDKKLFRPFLKFGSHWVIAMVAASLLVNVEKFFLARYGSVTSLGHYNVAFTLANMATLFTTAITQSLVPAFARLLVPGKRAEFDALFARSLRFNLIWVLPAAMLMFVVAKPFFTIWAGAEFGEESSPAFYILLFGLLFNIIAFIPYGTIMASGRADVFAKLYWVELVLYIFLAYWLVNSYQTIGAAAAWSIRFSLDALVIIYLAKRIVGVRLDFFRHLIKLFFGIILLIPPILFAAFYNNFSLWLIPMALLSTIAYFLIIWKTFIDEDEKGWFCKKLSRYTKMFFA